MGNSLGANKIKNKQQ